MNDEADEVVRYAEPARSYRSLLFTVLALAVGYGIDVGLTGYGAVVNLPGWLALGAVLVGMHAFFVYAARATHSLTVTDDVLRIGEESLPLGLIHGLADHRHAIRHGDDIRQVLGWPNARPRGVRSLVLRLEGDREVEVPTRWPARLQSALGIVDSPVRGTAVVRAATADDLALLDEIDQRADAIFRVAGYDLPLVEFDDDAAARAAAVFVVDDPPVGFAVVEIVDGAPHLAGLAVLPGSMRRGLGTMLVGEVVAWARAHGHDRVTLTTYADIAWNAPFYRRLGFAEASEAGPQLRARRAHEIALGLDAVGRRIVMRRDV